MNSENEMKRNTLNYWIDIILFILLMAIGPFERKLPDLDRGPTKEWFLENHSAIMEKYFNLVTGWSSYLNQLANSH